MGLYIAFFIFFIIFISGPPKYDILVSSQSVSPRLALSAALYNAGCTNMLIQHYIINASRSGISSAVLASRLNGVSGYAVKDADVVKWIAIVGAYDTAKQKKKGG